MTALINLTDVAKVYLTEELETRALWDVNLTVDEGEFLAITGPSGCGKSTLLSILGLMDVPSRGQVSLHGQDTSQLTLTQRARMRNQLIGFIFQSFHLIGYLTALDNVALPLLYADADRDERRAAAQEALDRVGMKPRAGHYPAQLSGGQQQRVAIARAIATQPLLILADEPTGNLDSSNSATVLQLLSEIHAEKQTTICLVTHDVRHKRIAERSIELLDGRVLLE